MELPYDTVKDTVRPGGGYNGFRKIEFSPPLLFGTATKEALGYILQNPTIHYHTLSFHTQPYHTIPNHFIPYIHCMSYSAPGALLAAASVDK